MSQNGRRDVQPNTINCADSEVLEKVFIWRQCFSQGLIDPPFSQQRINGQIARKMGCAGDCLPCHWHAYCDCVSHSSERSEHLPLIFLLPACLLNDIAISWTSKDSSPVLIRACHFCTRLTTVLQQFCNLLTAIFFFFGHLGLEEGFVFIKKGGIYYLILCKLLLGSRK